MESRKVHNFLPFRKLYNRHSRFIDLPTAFMLPNIRARSVKRISLLYNFLLVIFGGLVFSAAVYAADPQVADLLASSTEQSTKGMTLWQMLVAGGVVMVIIGLLSVVAGALIFYDFITLNVNKLAPREFFDQMIRKLKAKNLEEARDLCIKNESNIIAKITLSGLDKVKKGPKDTVVKEAMEHRARIEIGMLWQNLNYLSDIVAVSPLLGLLGTVLGMIQAFHAVPLETAGMKTTLLAAGISKAMITTAAGLIIAIPVLMAYSYFRGKVLEITNAVEIYITDIIRMIDSV